MITTSATSQNWNKTKNIFLKNPAGTKNIKVLLFFQKKLSYLVCSQIWLNLVVDDCHFRDITKLKKKTPGWHYLPWSNQ